jgi:hypothetical protein
MTMMWWQWHDNAAIAIATVALKATINKTISDQEVKAAMEGQAREVRGEGGDGGGGGV